MAAVRPGVRQRRDIEALGPEELVFVFVVDKPVQDDRAVIRDVAVSGRCRCFGERIVSRFGEMLSLLMEVVLW